MRAIVTLLVLTILVSGCSVHRAINQPDKKNLVLLSPGVNRQVLLAEFGEPMHSKQIKGQMGDVFSFVQGYGKPVIVGRALGHGVADIATFGLWEIVGQPLEAAFDGEKLAYAVYYNQGGTVIQVKQLAVGPAGRESM